MTYPEVLEAYVTGIADADRGQLVVAAVVPRAGHALDARGSARAAQGGSLGVQGPATHLGVRARKSCRSRTPARSASPRSPSAWPSSSRTPDAPRAGARPVRGGLRAPVPRAGGSGSGLRAAGRVRGAGRAAGGAGDRAAARAASARCCSAAGFRGTAGTAERASHSRAMREGSTAAGIPRSCTRARWSCAHPPATASRCAASSARARRWGCTARGIGGALRWLRARRFRRARRHARLARGRCHLAPFVR